MLVNGVDTGVYELSLHSTPTGPQLNFGRVTAGSVLTFIIHVNANGLSGHQKIGDVFSDTALNSAFD